MVAYLALFVALGGTAGALAGSVNGVTTNTCTYVDPALRGLVLG